jgi:hypothetical protein
MNRISTLLATAALVSIGSAHQDADENKYFVETLGKFCGEFEFAVANHEVSKFPSCVDNANTYETAYNTLDCANAVCDSQAAMNECCMGTHKWEDKQSGCENWNGDHFQNCCFECVNTAYTGYPFVCTSDPARIMGSIVCDSSPLSPATAPLPAGVYCEDKHIILNGTGYTDQGGTYHHPPTCDFLLDLVLDEGYSGQAVYSMISGSEDLMTMAETGALQFRPIVANGQVTYTEDAKCSVILSPHVNGKVEFNPDNVACTEDKCLETLLYNATVYDSAPPVVMNNGRYVVIGGQNHGEMKFNTQEEVMVGMFSNHGNLSLHSEELFMHNISNFASIEVMNSSASIQALHNHNNAGLLLDGNKVMAINMTNEGDILVKSGSMCILDIYMNYGTITIESGAMCEVYLNVNEHTGAGTLNLPSSGVTVIQGKYMPPKHGAPLVEAFGKWTTGAVRAGKSRWVGDESIEHGACDMFRFNTLGIRSVIQSPSNETFNAIVEISHPKRQLHVDLSYINVTLHDMDGENWHFSRYLFEDSDVITHFENPMPNKDGFVTASMDNFRVMVNIDFEQLNITSSMKNTVEIDVFSLRHARNSELRLDALDCVKLHDVGVAAQEYETTGI